MLPSAVVQLRQEDGGKKIERPVFLPPFSCNLGGVLQNRSFRPWLVSYVARLQHCLWRRPLDDEYVKFFVGASIVNACPQ